jgi:SAM-dependent methyltransferase
MRRAHFHAFAPVCPVCARNGATDCALTLATIVNEDEAGIQTGMLHCENPSVRHEFPIVDGIPIIVADVAKLLADRGVELLLRDDLPEALESLIGDAIGPDSWFDAIRQMQSTYGWDAYGDLDPNADAPAIPGAADRCLRRLLDIAGPAPAGPILDLGCAAGRTSFTLAGQAPDSLVLGIDLNLALLRMAQAAARGRIAYPRRRIGLVYDRVEFSHHFPGAARVDFWAADALALPISAGLAARAVALNLLDCVADPVALLHVLATSLRPGGHMLLATPFDWSSRATPMAAWIGGHSQRGTHHGDAEGLLRDLLTNQAHPRSVPGLRMLAEQADWPWQTRLHARSVVSYRTYLIVAEKQKAGGAVPAPPDPRSF